MEATVLFYRRLGQVGSLPPVFLCGSSCVAPTVPLPALVRCKESFQISPAWMKQRQVSRFQLRSFLSGALGLVHFV